MKQIQISEKEREVLSAALSIIENLEEHYWIAYIENLNHDKSFGFDRRNLLRLAQCASITREHLLNLYVTQDSLS